jgi:hypothetical protein
MGATDTSRSLPHGYLPPPRTRTALALGLTRLAAIGLLAIGASGLVAWAMGGAFGKAFVSGDMPGMTYTAARCADLKEYAPDATSCEQAAVAHHFGETVDYRVTAGILGLIVACGYLVLRRKLHEPPEGWNATLPKGFEATVGSAVFGLAAAGLLLAGASQLALGLRAGAGAPLSGGVIALAVAIAYGLSLLRALSDPEPTPTGGVSRPSV